MLRPKGPPETAPADALPWYAIPERKSRGTRLLFGHWSALGYRAIDDVYSLDTGCVWGGELTALRIDTARPGPRQCVACAGVLTVGALE
jgi:bis(5'-nucleosyl)-tetraphosphatase (symmetrical)